MESRWSENENKIYIPKCTSVSKDLSLVFLSFLHLDCELQIWDPYVTYYAFNGEIPDIGMPFGIDQRAWKSLKMKNFVQKMPKLWPENKLPWQNFRHLPKIWYPADIFVIHKKLLVGIKRVYVSCSEEDIILQSESYKHISIILVNIF